MDTSVADQDVLLNDSIRRFLRDLEIFVTHPPDTQLYNLYYMTKYDKGVECSNGQVGYGRRKREISGIPYDPKKVFEVTLTTYLKVDYKQDTLNKENPERIFKEKRNSQNYKVLNFNDSHIIPLEDLFDENFNKTQDNPNGKTIYFRASDETEDSSSDKNTAFILKPCLFSLILSLTLNGVLILQ